MIVAGCSRPAAPTVAAGNATVLWVVDGDTINVDVQGVEESVRLIGIDTPEKTGSLRPAECYGDEASVRLRELLPVGTQVFLEIDEEARDRYERLLAYVHRSEDNLFVNLTMVEEGYAASYPFEPNLFHADVLAAAHSQARTQGLGLWTVCGGTDLALPPSN